MGYAENKTLPFTLGEAVAHYADIFKLTFRS